MSAPPVLDAECFALQRALAGEYSLERELGRGGMGIVYLAREVQLERLVAIKVLHSALAAQPDARDRFLREARTAANLSHPNIVPIHRVGDSHGFVFFVMTYIDGETLGHRIREHGPLSANAAARLLRETAWALGHAHDHQVIHRDVKPDNILIERDGGRTLVTDFGIARVGAAEAASDEGKVMGTAHFMSPEQGRGDPVDARSDLYSLGVVGHYALTGRVPFDGTNASAIIAQHVHAPAPVLAETPAIPRLLSQAVDRCLRKEPAARFKNAKELADALEADAMSRLEFPAPIRNWLQTQNPLRGLLALWAAIGAFIMVINIIDRDFRNVAIIGAITTVPLLTLFGFHLSQTRRTLMAGYGTADLRLALDRWRQARREDLAFLASDLPKWMRLMRGATWIMFIAFIGGVAAAYTGKLSTFWFVRHLDYLGIATGSAFLIGNALGIPLVAGPKSILLDGGMRRWLWGSRLGSWLARQLSHGRTAPLQLMNRPTEAALSIAALELYDSLPKEHRANLSDLPNVVRRLEARAANMRQHVDALGVMLVRAEQDAPTGDVTKEQQVRGQLIARRDEAKRELGDTVAALETIRLGLMKLHGGVDVANTITELVEQAQSAAEDLDRLSAAAKELDLAFPGGITNA